MITNQINFKHEKAITEQFERGYNYYWVKYEGKNVGFLGFYPVEDKIYISNFIWKKNIEGKKLEEKCSNFQLILPKKKD